MWATQMQASQALPPGRRDDEGRWVDVWRERLDRLRTDRPWLFDALDHDRRDDYWRERDIPVERIEVPTFLVCGYRDLHAASVVDYFERIDAPKRLLLGPWRHTMPHRGSESAVDFRRQALAWYDQFLGDEETGVLDDPPVAYYTERDGGWRRDAGVWRTADRFAAGDDATTLAIAPAGLVPADAYGAGDGAVERTYEFDQTVGVDSMERIGMIQHTDLDARPDDARSLVFETPPLETPLELTGEGTVSLRIATTTTDPLLVARVTDVAPEGPSRPVSHGYLRASRRSSHADPTPLDPGREYAVDIRLSPRSHVFEAGRRLRLALSAAYFPRAEPAPEQGSFTVRSSPDAPATLTLPGRAHRDGVAFADVVEMSPPDAALVPPTSPFVRDGDEDWRVVRESGRVRFTATKTTRLAPPDGSELVWSHDVSAAVPARAPRAAVVRNDVAVTLERPLESVTAEATSRVARDYAVLTSRVSVDGEAVFDERWIR
jgi:hypothetical protein